MIAPREIEDAPVAGIPGGRLDPMAVAGVRAAHRVAQKPPRSRRPRLPDEERRLLREAEAAFEGGDRREDADLDASSAWDLEDEPSSNAAPSRLFRD